MATYNWQTNPYFTTNRYKATTGSDTTGDGTANKPYRTIQKCIDSGGLNIQCAPEIIREQFTGAPFIFFEDGCIYDNFSINTMNGNAKKYNIKIINAKLTEDDYTISVNTLIKGRLNANMAIIGGNIKSLMTVINPGTKTTRTVSNFVGANAGAWTRSTFVNQTVLLGTNLAILTYPLGMNRCIFFNCDIVCSMNFIDYSDAYDFHLFWNCRYKFGNDAVFLTQTQLETIYGVAGIDAVKAYYNAKFGTSNVLNHSKVADPLFNAPDYDDYTLQMMSPARHMSYEGTFIGAKDIAFPTYAYANDLGQPAAFYNASANANTIVSTNSVALVRNPDGSAVGNGEITEKPRNLGKIYELKNNQSSYAFSDRNREMLDVRADIDLSVPISAGTALINGVVYINEGGSVVYNGVTYINRSRITAVDSVQSFTTTEGAVLYAVLEYPNRYTNFIRHKQTIPGTQIAAGTAVLTVGSWYRVFTDSITWDGKTVPVGDSFQAVAGKLSFTGTGVVVEEFNEADVYSEVVIDAPIKCRRVGNVSTGAIDTGTDGKPLTNGHAEYYNATNRPRAEFSIFAAYIQKKWVLNTKMLK